MKDLLGLIVDLQVAAANMKLAREVILERAAQVLLESIKETIGNDAYTYGWLPLAPSTLERKGFDRPLFETGELQASYTYVMALNKREAWVGSNNPKAVRHEWGTGGPHPVPPRPVLQGAWDAKHDEIQIMAGRTMRSVVAAGALRSRELRELIHLAKKVYHEIGEFDREMDEHRRRE
jgi:phage gpG-like protein